ncbi:PREDICTED: uncharacterized protein LOC101314489 [Fragaria vesca subsp. vesca]
MWLDDPECRGIVEASWTDNSPTIGAAQWVTRSQRCGVELSKWSKKKFSNNHMAINRRIEELQVIQESTTVEARNIESLLIGEIGAFWNKEEKYWTQRARVNWLKAGDSNTKFFHLTTIQRRQRNKILKLKSTNDVWLDREGTIRSEVENYFKNIFKSSGERLG